MSKLLITGGSGFVGRNLAGFFAPTHEVVTTYLTGSPADDGRAVILDVRDRTAVMQVVDQEQPDWVIHLAGSKDVRWCEANVDDAHLLNALGTANIAHACETYGAQMVYLSTDYVFAGTRGGYGEDDTPQPASVYGRTKFEGEKLAVDNCSRVAICRSGGVYGPKSPLLRWFVDEIEAGRIVDCFTDVFNTPTYVFNLGEMLRAILEGGLNGIFHTAGSERTDRHRFFTEYARSLGVDASSVRPVSRDAAGVSALMPTDVSLLTHHTAEKLGIKFNSVEEGFARMKRHGGL